jgi:hypothetical protein
MQPERPKRTKAAPAVRVDTYRDDPLYPRIVLVVARLLSAANVVSPVDVVVGMGLLAPSRLDDWRKGLVPYLEQVVDCNLTKLSRLLRILRFHAHDLNLVPTLTPYFRAGKGPRQPLRFTRTGVARLEEAWSRHFKELRDEET